MGEFCSQREDFCASFTVLRKHFGGVPRTMLSLYSAMAGGISWAEYTDVLEPLGSVYVGIYLMYIVYSTLAIMNVLTGLFVETCLQNARKDNDSLIEEEMAEQLRQLRCIEEVFRAMDTDDSGTVGIVEFYEAMQEPRMVAFCNALDLSISEVDTLFLLLDPDRTGRIDISSFTNGFVALRGNARSIDLHKVMVQCNWLLHLMESREIAARRQQAEAAAEMTRI